MTRRHLLIALQVLGSVAAFAYLFSRVDVGEVWDAALGIPWVNTLSALGLTVAGLVVGAIRWRVMLKAYGAPTRPPLLELIRLYFVAIFYNTYLPGGVGGDVVRGVITRKSFGEAGATSAVTVVLVERVLGLAALLAIVASVLLVAPPAGLDHILGYAVIGILGAAVAVLGVAGARRVAEWFPIERLRPLLRSLPVLHRPAWFGLAILLSLGTQLLMAGVGWALLLGLAPGFRLADAIVIVPLANATAFLPISVGGAGAREAVFVALATTATSLDATRAATASMTMWGCVLLVGAVGGALQLTRRRETDA